MIRAIMLALCVALLGCGSDGAQVDASRLPTGDSDCPSGGWLLIVDGEELPVCNGVSGIDGAAGTDGTDGSAGAAGAAGANGANGIDMSSDGFTVTGSLFCSGVPRLPSGLSLRLLYNRTTFANGSSIVQCESGIGSSTIFWVGTEVGAPKGSCNVNSGVGVEWESFELQGSTVLATYHSSDVDDGSTWFFPAADCQ